MAMLILSWPQAVSAAADVPDWSYDSMLALSDQGYVRIPTNEIHNLSRQQMAKLTIEAMKNIEKRDNITASSDKTANQITNYAKLSSQDAAQYQMLKDTEVQLTARYKDLIESIKHNSKVMTYGSVQSTDNMAALKKIQAKEANDEAELADVVVRLRDIRIKLIQYQYILEAWKNKQDELMTQTISQAKQKLQVTANTDAMKEAAKLRVEFSSELAQAGYFDTQAAKNLAVIQVPPKIIGVDLEKRFKIDGEVRYDYRHNSNDTALKNGTRKYPDDRHRMRERLYMDYNLDNNWHLMGMLESDKAIKGDGKNGAIRLDRYYLQGHIGEALVTAGAFGYLMGEGNIYDSKYKGAMVDFGSPVNYRLSAGTIDQADKVYTAVATYKSDSYTAEAGAYRFNNLNGHKDRTILMGNFIKPIGTFNLGLMYLHGSDGRIGSGNGGVFTLSRGKYNSWLPGNTMWYMKYYYQPESTYVEHTMNGMADWMQGFKGYGFGYSRTLKKNLVMNLEYDMLRDLTSGEHNNTIWASLSWFFSNYASD